MADNNTDVRLFGRHQLFRGVNVSLGLMNWAACHLWLLQEAIVMVGSFKIPPRVTPVDLFLGD